MPGDQDEVAKLFAEIIANPASEEARLVYADHLIELGDPRGEMIQLQCMAERLTVDDPERAVLHERADDLFALHETEWTRELRALEHDWGMTGLTFRRGFVEGTSMKAERVPSLLPAVHASTPIRYVSIWTQDPENVARCGAEMATVEKVNVWGSGGSGPEVAKAIGRWPHAGQIRELAPGDRAAVEWIARTPALRGIRKLRLLALKPEHVATLCAATHLDTLEAFDLVQGAFGADGLRALATAPLFANMRRLDLEHARIEAEGFEALAAAPCAPQLEVLRLVGNPVGARGLAALVAAAPNLELIDLDSARVGEEGARSLLASKRDKLRRVDISRNKLGDAGIANAVSSIGLGSLEALVCHENDVRTAGAAALAAADLGELRWLDLAKNALEDDGLAALAATTKLPKLSRLGLARCSVGARGLAALGASDLGARLRSLVLDYNNVDDAGLAALLQANRLDALEHLEIWSSALTEVGIRALGASPVSRRLRHLTITGATAEATVALFGLELPELRSIGIDKVDDQAAHVLATTRGMPLVRRLSLRAETMTDDGAEALSNAQLDRVLWLELLAPSVSEVGQAELRRRYAHHVSVSNQALMRDLGGLGRRI